MLPSGLLSQLSFFEMERGTQDKLHEWCSSKHPSGLILGADQDENAPKCGRTIVVVPPQMADLVPTVVL